MTLMIKNVGAKQMSFVLKITIPRTSAPPEINGVSGRLHEGGTFMFKTGSLYRGIKPKESTFTVTSCTPFPPQ
jgi:hypothetical protein